MISKLINLQRAVDISVVGGKALNIERLMNFGFQVPAGYVLPVDATYDSSMYDEFSKLFSKLQPPLIVRSSASIEDAVTTSFAGQFESFFPIENVDDLIKAIEKVASSCDSEKIKNYLVHYNIDRKDYGIAAIIQEYKKPTLSGVIFVNSEGPKKELIIEMSGKAEAVVSGKDSPARYSIDCDTKKIIGVTGDKNYSDAKKIVGDLIDIALKIENKFGRPQDIEWVFDGDKIWIVQARPITAVASDEQAEIDNEINQLKTKFGQKPPHLVAHQFAEGLESATPLTASLFQNFFSGDGSFGQVMKSYIVPYKKFDVNNYVVSIFGRLYLNKDIEKDILFSRIPRKPIEKSGGLLSMPMYKTKWYFPGPIKIFSMLPGTVMMYFGDAKLQISAFRNYKKLEKQLHDLRGQKVNNLPPTIESAKYIVNKLVNDTTVLLFKISLFQQFALSYLEKKVKPNVTEQEWQNLIRAGIVDRLSSTINSGSDFEDILKKLSYRGFHELELSQPRWGEMPDKFKEVIGQIKKQKNEGSETLDVNTQKLREQVVERFPGVWDQQIVSTFFNLYDKFSAYREDMHDMWVREISLLRSVLLGLDRQTKLYNNIWYATLDEIFKDYPKLDLGKLVKAHQRHDILKKQPLQADIKVDNWDQIIEKTVSGVADSMSGFGLTSGQAEGIVGTIDMINDGKKVDILLIKNLDPMVTVYFDNIKGIVTEVGGQLAHATIVAREYGIPIVVLNNATGVLKAGQNIRINCSDGVVSIIK